MSTLNLSSILNRLVLAVLILVVFIQLHLFVADVLVEILSSYIIHSLLRILLETTQLCRVYHRKHLADALSYACNTFGGVSEGQLAPGHEVYFFAVQIVQILLAASA